MTDDRSRSTCRTPTRSARGWSIAAVRRGRGLRGGVAGREPARARGDGARWPRSPPCTERIKVGSGVVDIWTRNPARLASTFSTLDDLAPGRVILGIGAWWDPLAAKVGIDRGQPAHASMREVVDAVRALLANETVTFDGEYVHLDGVELDYVHQERRPKDVPIYIGATGMQMMELTGEIADGVRAQLPRVARPTTRTAMEHLAIGRGAGPGARSTTSTGRSSSCARVDEDRGRALDSARLLVTQYLGQQPHIMKASGVPAVAARRDRQGAHLAGHPRRRSSPRPSSCPTRSCR